MALKTVNITGQLYNPDGTPAANATGTAVLTKLEIDNGTVVPSVVSFTTDATGLLDINLWPNERGQAGSRYRLRAKTAKNGIVDTMITVPDSDAPVSLDDVIEAVPYPPVEYSKKILEQAQTAVDTANAAKTEAQTAAGLAVDAQADIHNNWQVKLDIATTQAGIATDKAAEASGSAATANAARDVAVLAKDAAMVGAVTYPDEATGRAAVADGEYFKVIGSGDVAASEYRRTNASESVLVAEYPSVEKVYDIDNRIPEFYSERFAAVISDGNGKAALTVSQDGAVRTAEFSSDSYSGVSENLIQSVGESLAGISATRYRNYEFMLSDSLGRVGFALANDGTTHASALETRTLNGVHTNAILNRKNLGGGNYTAELNGINCTGQSLAESSGIGPSLTTDQEYDNIGFPYASDSPTNYYPLTPAYTAPPPQIGAARESPMYGTCSFIKELIATERGLDPVGINYQLIACNNGYGSNSIYTLSKGQGKYEKAISQIQSAFNIANSEGRIYKFRATTWIQGESDGEANNYTNYLRDLKKLANDYNTDAKAITGQLEDAILITYQTTTITPSGPNIPLAQLAASIEDPLIYMACPLYQFDFSGDGVHLRAESAKWLGAYMGLVYTRVIIDGEDWSPVRPLSHSRLGSSIYLKFHVPVKPLVLDIDGVPEQQNYGFSVTDENGTNIAISDVRIIGNDTVKITTVSTVPVGGVVRYAQQKQTGKYAYIGGAGNLRDSQGDRLIFEAINKPMHNWCVFFNYIV